MCVFLIPRPFYVVEVGKAFLLPTKGKKWSGLCRVYMHGAEFPCVPTTGDCNLKLGGKPTLVSDPPLGSTSL